MGNGTMEPRELLELFAGDHEGRRLDSMVTEKMSFPAPLPVRDRPIP